MDQFMTEDEGNVSCPCCHQHIEDVSELISDTQYDELVSIAPW